MSTHAAIIEYLTDSGYPCYRGIWVYRDGYLAELGMRLLRFYKNAESVHLLIDNGYIRSVPEIPTNAILYPDGREPNIAHSAPIFGVNWRAVAKCINHENNVYIFENDKWFVYRPNLSNRKQVLSKVLKEEGLLP